MKTVREFGISEHVLESVRLHELKSDWYDYDKQEAISLPPVGVECEILYAGEVDWINAFVVGRGKCGGVMVESKRIALYLDDGDMLRPLDHNRKELETKARDEWVDRVLNESNISRSDEDYVYGIECAYEFCKIESPRGKV